MNKAAKQTRKSGPKPDRLIIEEDWEDAIGKALEKKRPKKGWPRGDEKESDE